MPEICLKELPGYEANRLSVWAELNQAQRGLNPLEARRFAAEKTLLLNAIGAVVRYGEAFCSDRDMADVESERVIYLVQLDTSRLS